MIKLSDYVLQSIAAAGARHVFLVPGGAAMHLNDSLGSTAGLTYVATLHEGAATVAAESYAKLTGGLGVAMVTSGPGSTNAVTGVASAWVNSAPLLVLAGQVKSSDIGSGGLRQLGLQEVDIESVVRPITKYAATVTDPSRVRFELEKALHLATAGRPGPVWLSFPLDVQAARIDPERLQGFEPPPPAPGPGGLGRAVAAIAEGLSRAERPLVLAGAGIRFARAQGEFLELVERLGVPTQTTWCAIDLLGQDHPLFAGRPGAFASRAANFALQNCDFLLSVGARWDLATTGFSPRTFARGARRVVVDVDPAEVGKLASHVTEGIVADAGDLVRAMLGAIPPLAVRDLRPWREQIARWDEEYPIVTARHRDEGERPSTYFLVERLAAALGAGDVVVQGSAGIYSEIFCMSYRVKAGQRVLCDGSYGAMGYGLPAAIGASLGHRGRTVLIDGDGSFQPNAQELATLAREGTELKIFVVNNDGYASIRASQARAFGRLVAADRSSGVALGDVCRLASAYGLPAVRVATREGLDGALRETLERPGPALCEVLVPPDEDREPRITSVQGPDGKMVSSPLEDMFPFLPRDEFHRNMLGGQRPEDRAPGR